MPFKCNVKHLALLLLLVSFSQVKFVYAQTLTPNSADETTTIQKTDLQDKYYRQALFYYFQDQPSVALSQIEQSKARLTKLNSRSALFEAGLQLSAGLLQAAKKNLLNFNDLIDNETASFANESSKDKSQKKVTKANELRLIALLSLTNQYLSKGDKTQAKDTLAQVTWVSASYYQEYHVLNQLAYWPEKNEAMLTYPAKDDYQSSPYIQLNNALRLIEEAQKDTSNFELAINSLKTIKTTQWHEKEQNFWKTLFIDDAIFSSIHNQQALAKLQNQAIQDYAKLLLAQIYISQEQYQQAFNELQSFPEQSPYTESAMFLFAFASQQVKQFGLSFSLLNLLYKNYPYSSLGWQAAELMAQQVSDEQSLAQGVSAYQTVEQFFLTRQQSLDEFSVAFKGSNNLLHFSQSKLLPSSTDIEVGGVSSYLPGSIWLQQALLDNELASLYKNLISIDKEIAQLHVLQDKALWISQIIALNKTRKQKIITAQEERNKQGVYKSLTAERDRLAALLEQATSSDLSNNNHSILVNTDQKSWLARIARSKQALDFIGDKKETSEYKERLARVEGVLSWQLTQQYPARAWGHTKQLQQLDKVIASVNQQTQQIVKTSNTQNTLALSVDKHSKSNEKIASLLTQLTSLREKVSINIRSKVQVYIDGQQLLLAEHLLSSRRGMAKVLERMAHEDKRLSTKLVPTASVYSSGEKSKQLKSAKHNERVNNSLAFNGAGS